MCIYACTLFICAHAHLSTHGGFISTHVYTCAFVSPVWPDEKTECTLFGQRCALLQKKNNLNEMYQPGIIYRAATRSTKANETEKCEQKITK